MTGLGILVLIAAGLLIGTYLVFTVFNHPLPPPMHVGLLPATMEGTADQLNVFGSIAGFSAVNGRIGTLAVRRGNASADRLGGIGMTLSIFAGSTGGTDLSRTAVSWTDRAGTETIPQTRQQVIICPNWTIVSRHNRDPARPADDDDILEPGELFDIFACPSKTYAPYETFTVVFDPYGSGPRFPVECTVPFPITPVMML